MITLAITTFNRTDLLYESYEKVKDDKRISEIVIVDDCSNPEVFEELQTNCIHPKIKLHRNEENLGMLKNKRRAIELSSNPWVIVLDSDNIIDERYLDALWEDPRSFQSTNTIYCPSSAEPNFDYRKYSGKLISKYNAKDYMDDKMFRACLNTMNNVVHRDTFLKHWTENKELKGADTVWMNYKWMEAGNCLYVVPGMPYFHRVHSGSGWLQDANENIKHAKQIEKLISEL